MVYHDCQICYGKYGYQAGEVAEYVAHHVLCARPLHYHSFPDHLYWESEGQRGQEAKEGRACYARSDSGWAESLHPLDVFLKNTHEILGPLHSVTAYDRLTELEFLRADGTVRQTVYGAGPAATTVTVNFGPLDTTVSSASGGDVVLPPYGFLVEGPRFVAFHAKHWNGQDYGQGALFTLRSVDDKNLEAGGIRVFHGFGPATLRWKGRTYEVAREHVIRL